MTATELQKYIGTTGKFQANGFRFEVKVTDARCVRSRLELLVVPMAGCWFSDYLHPKGGGFFTLG